MIDAIARHVLGLGGGAVLAIVFALPLMESSALLGVVVPGETAVLLGGLLASPHRVNLAAVIAAAIAGAIVGDSIGYTVGRRYGPHLLAGRAGRLVKTEHRERAERYLAQRGGAAVLFGRFTAALRALIPGLAGMAGMPYRRFVASNVAGGTLWATAMVLAGYLAGASWQQAAHWASRTGLAILALAVLGLGLRTASRAARQRPGTIRTRGLRVAYARPVRWLRRRHPTQVAWLVRRLDATSVTGLPRTATLASAALAVWLFAGLTQDVLAREELALADPRVHAFVVAHRSGWVTTGMRTLTWLGSSYVLLPVLLAASVFLLLHRRDRWAAVRLWMAYLGAVLLYTTTKALVHRPRPPLADMIGHAAGPAFPSGHATQALAGWGILALVPAVGHSRRTHAWLLVAAAIIAGLVGAPRVYLGAHWMTDVLAGWSLAAAWLALSLAVPAHSTTQDTHRRTGPRHAPRGIPTPPQPTGIDGGEHLGRPQPRPTAV